MRYGPKKTKSRFFYFFLDFDFKSRFWHNQTCFTVINAFCVILFFYWMYTNKSRPFTIPIIFMKRSCFHCWKRNKSSDCSNAHAHTFKLVTKCSLFIIIIWNNRSNIWKKKHTALFKYVVQSVLFSVITVPLWSYAKHFVLCGYCKGGK